MNDKLKVKRITPTWFIGRSHGVVFFGATQETVTVKYWDYMRSTSRKGKHYINAQRVTDCLPDKFVGFLLGNERYQFNQIKP